MTLGKPISAIWSEGNNVPYYTLSEYDSFTGIEVKLIGGTFFILWPLHKTGLLSPDDRNLDSVILCFEMGKFSLLLGSDAKGDVWPQLDQTALKADIFRYPHHGGKLYKNKDDWSADELISKVNPDWVVISVGKNNPYGHPSEEFRQAKSRYPTIQFLDTTKGNIRLQIESSAGNIIKMRESNGKEKRTDSGLPSR